MADPGSEFKPVEKREAKRFEPPPWERDQFEELARQRAEQEAQEAEQAKLAAEAQAAIDAAAAAQAARSATAEEALASDAAGAQAPSAAAAGAVTAPEAVAQSAVPASADAEAATSAPQPAVPGPAEEHVNVMLAGLAAEEPPAATAFWRTSVTIGAAVVVFGATFLILGIATLLRTARTGIVGLLGGSVLLIFGAGFVAGGVYVVIKNLRQQGVL